MDVQFIAEKTIVDFDETFDWIVAGSGAGSMSSALMMRQAGHSVLILEKSPWAGGTTCKSGGVIWVPNNRFMDPSEDSAENALTYLGAVVGDPTDAPGTSEAKRLAYVLEAPRMIDFLVDQGVELERGSRFWPDYYDELPGGCKTSRTVTAKPFDVNELGEWAPRLRKGFLEVPVRLDDGMKLAFVRESWRIKALMVKIAFRIAAGKLMRKHWVTAGAALQGRMLKQVLNRGAQVRLNSLVTELLIEDGKAIGVATVKDGRPWLVRSRLGVLVNAGGFAKNQEMRDIYMPGTRAEWSMTNESDTGDMHREMERHGAVLAQMDEMVGYQLTLAPGWQEQYVAPGMQSVTAKPHAILVDQTGARYLNEGGSYEEYCERMLKRNATVPAVPSWAIFDQQFWDRYEVAGAGHGKKVPATWQNGYLKKADTIGRLAVAIGVEPAKLKGTIGRWNHFVDCGRDEDFRRGDREYDKFLGDPFREGVFSTLGSIEKAPFYAVEVVPGDVSTYGGVVTDADARVLRSDGSAIDGLYATGVSAASPMGRVYPGAGASIGPSMCFGWLAAKHAILRANSEPAQQ